ncbi:hypothetical protein D9757_010631 [Collybiopsis confluens]|uniref:Uncharacterized protein n=1 Tax=Collybiopsis confluens TaxID=2823264 RepID=A0A8H5GS83_9AGAR|nr:hypothetical protein D9757_010631 [Collybiopsis confluens]
MSDTLSQSEAYFISLICGSILAGLYTFLFCVALFLQLRQREKGRTNIIILVLTIVMYCLSVVHMSFCFQVNWSALFGEEHENPDSDQDESETSYYIVSCIPIGAEILNCIIGDAIVIWRTWVLWNRECRVIYVPFALLLGGAVAGILMFRSIFISVAEESSFFDPGTRITLTAFCTLTTTINIYAIMAIGYRVWSHTRAMKALGSAGVGGFYRRIFLIFVESGFVYCALPILMIILFCAENSGVYIVMSILAQVTGIYPTAIIVLVCLQLTQHDHITRKTESAMNFRRSTNILTRNSGIVSATYRSKPNAILGDKQEHFGVTEDVV